MFNRFRQLPILCLVLSCLVAWPEQYPLASINLPGADRAPAFPTLVKADASVRGVDAPTAPGWSRESSSLDDAEDSDGQPEARTMLPGPADHRIQLPGLIPATATLRPSALGGHRQAFALAPPLRC
ncbi:hypothetical protein TA3x_004534 [Tundrisphaera sp. TA3]|uniref:hypothetical protein n=1 Tax=Tundrisphaera sp. TA3 TaxID=3435775 RepID=UPI003EB83168